MKKFINTLLVASMFLVPLAVVTTTTQSKTESPKIEAAGLGFGLFYGGGYYSRPYYYPYRSYYYSAPYYYSSPYYYSNSCPTCGSGFGGWWW